MGMSPPSTMLDLTFLSAIADAGDANHGEAVALYQMMIDDFVAQRGLLVARNDHLATFGKTDLFAAVDKIYVARQHRNAAEELRRGTPVDTDVAITLVLIHRMNVGKVATFDERLNHYNLDLVTASRDTPELRENDGWTKTSTE